MHGTESAEEIVIREAETCGKGLGCMVSLLPAIDEWEYVRTPQGGHRAPHSLC